MFSSCSSHTTRNLEGVVVVCAATPRHGWWALFEVEHPSGILLMVVGREGKGRQGKGIPEQRES